MVTGITGACGKMKRTGPTACSCSSLANGTKSLPSAPRPCSTMTVAVGSGAVSISMVSSRAMGAKAGLTQGPPLSYTPPRERGPTLALQARESERTSPMQVQVNTSNGIENKDSLERWADQFLNEALARFRQDITRVEVQLRDANSSAGGAQDKRCMLEARITGHEPVAATH